MQSQSSTADFIIVGGGIFGITAALELRTRGFSVILINDSSIPSERAASNDISKVVRMEYGSDEMYMEAAARSIGIWREWNHEFGRTVYHETGFLLLSRTAMEDAPEGFEAASYRNLVKRGYQPVRLNESAIDSMYPVFASSGFCDGFYHGLGGFANASLTLRLLLVQARNSGVRIIENERILPVLIDDSKSVQLKTANGKTYAGGHVIVAAGASSQVIVGGLKDVLVSTGHPVFHLEVDDLDDSASSGYPVFAADISRTGWYGFPPHPESGVIKIANHGQGKMVHPGDDDLLLDDPDREKLHSFVAGSMRRLGSYRIVYERRCLYSDTFDGHFLIDRHPEADNLTVAAGGSGHAFKMAPVLGAWIADAAAGYRERVPSRFHWRKPVSRLEAKEEARFTDY